MKKYKRLTPKSNLRYHCDKCEFATGDYYEAQEHGGKHEVSMEATGAADKEVESSSQGRTLPRTKSFQSMVERMRGKLRASI